jgi:ribosomal protein S27AE
MAKMDPNSFDYRQVPCPRCGAKVGGYCIRPSGHSGPIVAAHKDRINAAQAMWGQQPAQAPIQAEQPVNTPSAALPLFPEPGTQLALF